MRLFILLVPILVFAACQRKTAEDGEKLKQEVASLIASRDQNGDVKGEALARLKGLTPSLQKGAQFWKVVGTIPESQLSTFRDAVIASFRTLSPRPGDQIDRDYMDALRVAGQLKDPEIAEIALTKLTQVPAYHFPNETPPPGWPTAVSYQRFAEHGYQGKLATMVVEAADGPTMDKYRAEMLTADPALQRVMIWGLSRSVDEHDFNSLLRLKTLITDPGTQDTIVHSLNRMIVSMRSVAEHPEIVGLERRPKDLQGLAQIAAQCEAELKQQNLIVAIGLYD